MTEVRRYHHRDFTVAELVEAKDGLTVSVVMPARDEAETVAGIVTCLRADLVPAGLVDEVLVVDDGSTDGTASLAAAAGARVVTAGTLLDDEGWGPGKGGAMWEGLYASSGDLVVFLDADVSNFGRHFVTGLLGPLLADPEVAMVKAFYARPLLSVLFPHLASVVQPLAGEYAGRREVLERVPFAHGYGVELGLLVDVCARVGPAGLAQVDLGTRVHRNRPLAALSAQATAVLCAALQRAGVDVAPDHAVLERPGGELVVVRTGTHPPLAELRELRTA